MQLASKLEKDLFELANLFSVGSKSSDICLRAIIKIQQLEGEIVDLEAKTRRPL